MSAMVDQTPKSRRLTRKRKTDRRRPARHRSEPCPNRVSAFIPYPGTSLKSECLGSKVPGHGPHRDAPETWNRSAGAKVVRRQANQLCAALQRLASHTADEHRRRVLGEIDTLALLVVQYLYRRGTSGCSDARSRLVSTLDRLQIYLQWVLQVNPNRRAALPTANKAISQFRKHLVHEEIQFSCPDH